MRNFLIPVVAILVIHAGASPAQELPCDACVDAPSDSGESSPSPAPGVRTVITAEQMRNLGFISVADLAEQLAQGAAGYGTRHFDIGGNYAALGVPVAELGALFDEIYDYVSARTGVSVDGLIPVTVEPADTGLCPIRGRASNSHIWLYAGAATSREQILGVLAHELGHVLQFREVPAIFRLGGSFPQGYASWAAGRYWTDWQGYRSFAAAVADYLDDGSFLPLSSPPVGFEQTDADAGSAEECLARRDTHLNEWASLIEFLVSIYGREGFYERAEAAPEDRTGAFDYAALFDRDLERLEADWLEYVRAQQ